MCSVAFEHRAQLAANAVVVCAIASRGMKSEMKRSGPSSKQAWGGVGEQGPSGGAYEVCVRDGCPLVDCVCSGRAGEQCSRAVASVAKRYKLSAAQVADWNNVGASAAFKAGQQVVLFLPVRTAAGKPARASAGAKSGARAGAVAKSVPTRQVKTTKSR